MRAETRFHFRTGITSTVPRLVMSASGSLDLFRHTGATSPSLAVTFGALHSSDGVGLLAPQMRRGTTDDLPGPRQHGVSGWDDVD
jgi:hypothetical protein